MPKKDKSVGRSLMKDHKRRYKADGEGYRHTCDLDDGLDVGKLSMNSVTQQSDLQEFLDRVELAESESKPETVIVNSAPSDGILTEEELSLISSAQDQNKEIICIPRRPPWDENTSKDVLNATERESFLVWRRKLSELQEVEHINLTPFEKNLEIWRQLWRVIERSDVVVQIIDARNPLLFRCPDLEHYVKEVDDSKINVLLMNKADFLTETQRLAWCEYFAEVGIQVVFFSALQEGERPAQEESALTSGNRLDEIDLSKVKNTPEVLSREELVNFFKAYCKNRTSSEGVPTVGLVGYPNVGKSSTVNALLMCKKVSVSATPGKTKHFQTHHIDEDLCLCDCPGLVFPNFVSTKADMVVNGILPIDQLNEFVQPVSLIARLIPRKVLQSTYSILIRVRDEHDPKAPPTAEELLNAHGYNRGFMTQRGMPDNARSARYVLKDFVNGKLLFCYAPPGTNQEAFHLFPDTKRRKVVVDEVVPTIDSFEKERNLLTKADKKFFSMAQVHMKGHTITREQLIEEGEKPWKKHYNRNKKEKLRKIYKNPYDC